MGITQRGPVKRVRHNKSLTVGCVELDLSSIRVIEDQLYKTVLAKACSK